MSREGFTAGVDGAPLHYRVVGSGEPTLVLCDGVGCAGYAWRYLIEHFRDRFRLVHWHYRGHGLSGAPRDLIRLDIADHAEDCHRILEHLGIENAVLVGHSMGVQVILEYYRQYPKEVLGLVPICGSFGRVFDTFHGTGMMKSVFPHIYRLATGPLTKPLMQAVWSLFVPTSAAYALAEATEINPRLVKPEDFQPYLETLSKLDVEVFTRCLAGAAGHTAEDLLERIDVPVLIVAAEHDNFTPVWLSEKMHQRIRDSELLLLAGGTHTAPIELPEAINERLDRFLRERVVAKPGKTQPRGRGALRSTTGP